MTDVIAAQRALLAQQIQVIHRLLSGATWSLERLPVQITFQHLNDPAVAERLASLNDRFTKLQDQLAGSLRHAHQMLGERYRSYADVVDWAHKLGLINSVEQWLELRALRNQLTHEYDLQSDNAVELARSLREAVEALRWIVERFEAYCRERGLLV